MTNAELEEYYKALLILQYHRLPKARGTVGAYVAELIASQIIAQVEEAFNLDTAVGVQLDMLATYRGAIRKLFGIDLDKGFFAMPEYGASPSGLKGFSEYDDDPPDWYFLDYGDTSAVVYTMTDAELRALVKYLAQLHRCDVSMSGIDEILLTFFDDFLTVEETGPMEITYTHDVTDPNKLFFIVEKLKAFPRPGGVKVLVA